ncbi:hypothetical protein ACRAWD_19760 [Caulobacter segnis]
MSRKLALVGVLGCVATGAAHAQESKPAVPTTPRPSAQSTPQPAAKPVAKPVATPPSAAKPVTPTRTSTPRSRPSPSPPPAASRSARCWATSRRRKPSAPATSAAVRGLVDGGPADRADASDHQRRLGGDPVVLLNGRRISGQGEIRDIPTEAIQRVEILPEEVALKHGYSADQKVVNIVLRQRFRAQTLDAMVGGSTAGGQMSQQAAWSQLRPNRQGRSNLAIKVQNSDQLLESDRDLVSRTNSGLYDFTGNVAPLSGDLAALSALAGTPVTVAWRPGFGRQRRAGPLSLPADRQPGQYPATSPAIAPCCRAASRWRSTASPTATSSTTSRRR